ncbi:MAG: dehydratase [Planctomycetes bacterium]|nr:dehydratase [Planctomycetota bacterium]
MDAQPVSSPRGLWFDEFEPGQSFRSATRTCTQAEVDAFATLTGDHNPIHTDAAFAARTPFRGRIAHGLLIESLASGLAWDMGIFRETIVALSKIEMEFVAPLRPPSEMSMVLRVLERDPTPGPKRGWVSFSTEVENSSGEVVLRGKWLVVMQRKRMEPGGASR